MTGRDTVTQCRLLAASLAASTKKYLSWWAVMCFPCPPPPPTHPKATNSKTRCACYSNTLECSIIRVRAWLFRNKPPGRRELITYCIM